MRSLVAGLFAAVFAVAQTQANAAEPAPVQPQAAVTGPIATPAPAPVGAPGAIPAPGWYYLPAGWYLLVPAGLNANTSGIPAGPRVNAPGPVALPAGIAATAATAPVVVIQPALPQSAPAPAQLPPARPTEVDSFFNQ